MNVDIELREQMLELLKQVIVDNPLPTDTIGSGPSERKPKRIYFLDGADNVLSTVVFDDMKLIPATGTSAAYYFEGPDGSDSLIAAASQGTVSKFVICGKIDGDFRVILSGSAGNTSSSDIQFNRASWNNNTFLTISGLEVRLPQGS